VVNSAVATQEGQVLPVSPFLLDKTSADRPSEFGIVFVADDATRYEYFCALTSQRVEKEELCDNRSHQSLAHRQMSFVQPEDRIRLVPMWWLTGTSSAG
jgi:hypothetical protein